MRFGHEELGLTIIEGQIPPFELLQLMEQRCSEVEKFVEDKLKKDGK